MTENQGHLPLAPQIPALPGKGQVPATKCKHSPVDGVTKRLPTDPYDKRTSSLPQIAETYAFLPREAVTRFLMSCTECQKRMHFNSNGLEPKGRGGGGRAGGWQVRGAVQGEALPPAGPAQTEKCTSSRCHNSQRLV